MKMLLLFLIPWMGWAATSPDATKPAGIEWVEVEYDEAENEMVRLFMNDLGPLEEIGGRVVLYQVRATGQLPAGHHKVLRSKLEQVLLNSKKLTLVDCGTCDQSRLERDDTGKMRFHSRYSSVDEQKKIADELKVDKFIIAELKYRPEEMSLRLRMVRPQDQAVLWQEEYSSQDVVQGRKKFSLEKGAGVKGENLSRLVIGQIAFGATVNLGVTYLPAIQKPNGVDPGRSGYPTVGIAIGEHFDQMSKYFGLGIEAMVNFGDNLPGAEVLPWALKLGPQFKYTFNPFEMSNPRWIAGVDFGALISPGITTGYIAVGPELKMINRFSVAFQPMYILSADAKEAQVINQQDDLSFASGESDVKGKFGGLGLMMKVNIYW